MRLTGGYSRAARESPARSALRLAIAALVLVVLATSWRLARPAIVYRLALANLGNECGSLPQHAMQHRHPALGFDIDPEYRSQLQTYRARGFAGAVTNRTANEEWTILDAHLDPLTTFRGNVILESLDDRDGDGFLEATGVLWGCTFETWLIFRLGEQQHALLAVVEMDSREMCDTLYYRPWPMWTLEGRGIEQQLQWVSQEGNWPAFELRWQPNGTLTCEQLLPAGFRAWLARTPDEVPFCPDERLNDLALPLLGQSN